MHVDGTFLASITSVEHWHAPRPPPASTSQMATNEALDAAISAVERRAAAMQPQQDDLIGLLDDYNTMRDKLKESSGKRQVNALPYLQPNTQRLVCMAEASVGRTRTAIAELAKSRWKLDKHSFADAFDYQTLISQDFISELRTLLGATTCNWDHAYCAILTARNDRISRATARSGISSSRTWIRQDIKDAAKKLGIEKTSASQRKKKRKVCLIIRTRPAKLHPVLITGCWLAPHSWIRRSLRSAESREARAS